MGCFSQTCCISNLPITAGDDVKYLLLTENPYEDENLVCSMHDMWFPRSLPVNAKYNDYGSIEDYDLHSPAIRAIVEALKLDLIEVGTGDNSIHDVPTQKNMDFSNILIAVWEGRILVERDRSWEQHKLNLLSNVEEKTWVWLPTLQNITQLLISSGFAINNTSEGFLVDERAQGWIRIRVGGFGSDDNYLNILLPLLQKHYAAMITTGSESGFRNEIQVMPLPAQNPKEHRSFLNEREEKPLKVFQAMILKEVWNKICQLGNYDHYFSIINDEWSNCLNTLIHQQRMKDSKNEEIRSLADAILTLSRSDSSLRDPVPFTVGRYEHFKCAAEQHIKTPFTEAQIFEFISNIAGLICISEVLPALRYWWRPSFSCGPQFGEFQRHEEWHTILTDVSTGLKKKHSWDENDENLDEDDKNVEDS